MAPSLIASDKMPKFSQKQMALIFNPYLMIYSCRISVTDYYVSSTGNAKLSAMLSLR
jgi:hypothetical protein